MPSSNHILTALSVVTFYIPLFFWAIPRFNQQYMLEHHVPVDIHVQHSLSNDPVLMKCPAPPVSEVIQMYNRLGLCFSPVQFEGLCDGHLITTTWIDVTYSLNNETLRDPDTVNELPVPFNYMRYEEICSRDWLFDPLTNILSDESKSGRGKRSYEGSQEYESPIFVLFFLNIGGLIPMVSVVTVAQALTRMIRLMREAPGSIVMELEGLYKPDSATTKTSL